MNQLELNKLLAFYQRALEDRSVENIERAVNLLQKHLPNVDQQAAENLEVLAKLKQVHHEAILFIQKERDLVKAEMDSFNTNKARDFAYQRTQLSQ
ncbi:hypothetical protein [Vibrio ziniensis]|uniref:Uncharacterized protein n=1 Tax=Vibrio ziniensis TaxID=2711221 RepID=A0A6G7CHI8_9VIBR|nr:hypothetical protein [Vibrio ziniensis]QIH41498.1 hypothetical protein G5S32_05600 [Vibrio ziniensis]